MSLTDLFYARKRINELEAANASLRQQVEDLIASVSNMVKVAAPAPIQVSIQDARAMYLSPLKTSMDVIDRLRERAGKSSQKDVAAELGVSPQYLNDVLLYRRDISHPLARKLGYEKISYYLPDEEAVGSPPVEGEL